jgi:four helix bundle protein
MVEEGPRVKITSYKDLVVWRQADELAHRIYDLTDNFSTKYLYDLTSQLRRAALSIPTNIAEGCASIHTGELVQFLNVARRSLSETEYLLGFACRRNLMTREDLLGTQGLASEVGKKLNALIRSLRSKSLTGHRPLTTVH